MSKQTIYKIYGIALLFTTFNLFIYIFLNHYFDGSIWQTMRQSKSALTAEYCELDNSTHFFRQTMNTYSNLVYFFLGMIVILISFYDRKNKTENQNIIQQFPLLSFLFGCCLVYLSIGSAFFHASLTWFGQRADMNGTYSICVVLLGISSYKLFVKANSTKNFKSFLICFLLLIIITFLKLHLLISSIVLLPLLILSTTILTSINYLQNKNIFNIQLAVLSLLLMIGAFVLRTLDVEKIVCDPISFYQGHALWHCFTGMSAFLLYWFYRTEKS